MREEEIELPCQPEEIERTHYSPREETTLLLTREREGRIKPLLSGGGNRTPLTIRKRKRASGYLFVLEVRQW